MGKQPAAGLVLLSMRQLADPAPMPAMGSDALRFSRAIAQWVTSYLMASHPELGRSGEVCPFTSRAYQLDTIRIGVSFASSRDSALITELMRDSLRQFASIACDDTARQLRTVIVGFPNLGDADGVAALRAGQQRLTLRCLWDGLMIGRFHPDSDDDGLWNPDFRPMRAPVPLLAVRHLVRNDAPFALRHPALLASYLCRYSAVAPRQLLANFAKQRARRDERPERRPTQDK
jgi:hypothetical protein